MNLELTEEQETFRATARRFLDSEAPMAAVRDLWEDSTGFDRGWWQRAADLGWTSLFASEADGGGSLTGRPTSDAVIVAEEIGRAAAPGPFQTVNVCVAALAVGAGEVLRGEVVPGLLGGTSIATWAFAEAGDEWRPGEFRTSLGEAGDHVVVDGEKQYVEAAGVADWFLVTGRSADGLGQVLVAAGAPGVSVVPGRSIDLTRRFGTVRFDGVRVPRSQVVGSLGQADGLVERQLQIALSLQCAGMNGAAGRVFDDTLEYAKQRYAFGRPIGSFQALKHRFADMLQRLEFARAIADAAAGAVDEGRAPAVDLVRVAKAYVADAAVDIIDDCVQINGGVGVTWEHDVHVFSRRVALERAVFGSPELHKQAIADHLEVAHV